MLNMVYARHVSGENLEAIASTFIMILILLFTKLTPQLFSQFFLPNKSYYREISMLWF